MFLWILVGRKTCYPTPANLKIMLCGSYLLNSHLILLLYAGKLFFHWCYCWSHQIFGGLKAYLLVYLSGHLWLDWGSRMISHEVPNASFIPAIFQEVIFKKYLFTYSTYLKWAFKVRTHYMSKLQLSIQLCKEQCSPWTLGCPDCRDISLLSLKHSPWRFELCCFHLHYAFAWMWQSVSFGKASPFSVWRLLLKMLYRKSYKGDSMRKRRYRLIREKNLGKVWKKWSKMFT